MRETSTAERVRMVDATGRAAGACCGRASKATCERPPCPFNIDTYSDDELREIEARKVGATSFNVW